MSVYNDLSPGSTPAPEIFSGQEVPKPVPQPLAGRLGIMNKSFEALNKSFEALKNTNATSPKRQVTALMPQPLKKQKASKPSSDLPAHSRGKTQRGTKDTAALPPSKRQRTAIDDQPMTLRNGKQLSVSRVDPPSLDQVSVPQIPQEQVFNGQFALTEELPAHRQPTTNSFRYYYDFKLDDVVPSLAIKGSQQVSAPMPQSLEARLRAMENSFKALNNAQPTAAAKFDAPELGFTFMDEITEGPSPEERFFTSPQQLNGFELDGPGLNGVDFEGENEVFWNSDKTINWEFWDKGLNE